DGAKGWENPVVTWLYRLYERALRAVMRSPATMVGASALIVAAAFALGTYLGSEFLPQLDEGVIWVRANLPAGISLQKSAEVAAKIRGSLGQFPEVKLVSSQSGRNDSGTDPYGPNRNELFVALQPYDTWPSGKRKADLVEEFARKLKAEIPGAAFSFTQP